MKALIVLLVSCLALSAAKLQCQERPADCPREWVTMVDSCTHKMRKQVQEELFASIQYLSMAAHFSRDTVNRPGFAKMFFEAASEERQHAMKIMEYLLMRGGLTSDVSSLIRMPEAKKQDWPSGVAALKDALRLEAQVTNLIRDVIVACETGGDDNFNDYHLVDYLTADFLDEQYKGQRDLAGKTTTLDKMMATHGALGEFLFDKKLLAGEI